MRLFLIFALVLGFAVVSARAAAELVDINHASMTELETLPGVREAYAAVIVRHRPYKNKTQLRKYLPSAAYKQIRQRIVAKQD